MSGESCQRCGHVIATAKMASCIYCGAPLDRKEAEPEQEEPIFGLLRAAFVQLKRSISGGDLGPVVPLLSANLAQSLAQELEQDRRSNLRHVIDHVVVDSIALDGPEENLVVRFDAHYAEY